MEVALVLLSVLEVAFAFFFTRFLWTFFALVLLFELAVEAVVWLDVCDWFCTFFAAFGAAIRKGTAATVKTVDVNSFFIFFSFNCGGFLSREPARGSGSDFLVSCFCRCHLVRFPCRSQLYFACSRPFPPSPRIAILGPVFSG